MNIQLLVTMLILWLLAALMWVRKLDILINRYEGFQRLIHKRTFSVNMDGVAKYYTVVLVLAGIVPALYMLSSYFAYFRWVGYALSIVLIGSIIYLNISKRFLIFRD